MANTIIPSFLRRGLQDNQTFQNLNLFGCQFGFNRQDAPSVVPFYYLFSTQIPGRSVNIGEVRWLNGKFLYLKTPKLFGVWGAQFIVDEAMTLPQLLEELYQKTFATIDSGSRRAGEIGNTQEAKIPAIDVFLLNTKGQTRTLTVRLYNCLINSYSGVGRDETGRLEMGGDVDIPVPGLITASFSYEYHRVTFNAAEGTEGSRAATVMRNQVSRVDLTNQ